MTTLVAPPKRLPTAPGWYLYRAYTGVVCAAYAMRARGGLVAASGMPLDDPHFAEWLGPMPVEALPWPPEAAS